MTRIVGQPDRWRRRQFEDEQARHRRDRRNSVPFGPGHPLHAAMRALTRGFQAAFSESEGRLRASIRGFSPAEIEARGRAMYGRHDGDFPDGVEHGSVADTARVYLGVPHSPERPTDG